MSSTNEKVFDDNIKIVTLERDDLLKFRNLFYDELLLTLPDDIMMLGAIDVSGNAPKAVGLMIFHARETSVYIDWLYVDEEQRRRGIGTMLLNNLKTALIDDPDASIKTVFMNFDETIVGMGAFLRENAFAVAFYDGEFNIFAPLKSVRLMKQKEGDGRTLRSIPLSEVKKESFDAFESYLDKAGDEVMGVVGPIEASDYRPESRAIMDGDKIVGIMLVGNTVRKDTVIIDWVYSVPKHVLVAVPLAFDDVITQLRKNLPENTMISMASMNQNVGSIIRKTMPGAVFLEAYCTFWLVDR